MREYCNVEKLADLLSSNESSIDLYELYETIRCQINTFEDAEKAIENGTITEENLLALLENIGYVSNANFGYSATLKKVCANIISSRMVANRKRRLL